MFPFLKEMPFNSPFCLNTVFFYELFMISTLTARTGRKKHSEVPCCLERRWLKFQSNGQTQEEGVQCCARHHRTDFSALDDRWDSGQWNYTNTESHGTSVLSGVFHYMTTLYFKLFLEIIWKRNKRLNPMKRKSPEIQYTLINSCIRLI